VPAATSSPSCPSLASRLSMPSELRRAQQHHPVLPHVVDDQHFRRAVPSLADRRRPCPCNGGPGSAVCSSISKEKTLPSPACSAPAHHRPSGARAAA
jgi:hypothetical protein